MRREIKLAIADLERHGFGVAAFIADMIFSSTASMPTRQDFCSQSSRRSTPPVVCSLPTRCSPASDEPVGIGGDSSDTIWFPTS